MIYLITSIVLFITQFFLIGLHQVKICAELFYFPWLVSKGLLPYRDFFDHHGFLLYYLLAPLAHDTSLTLTTIFFYMSQAINLALVLMILKRITNVVGFILCGILFTLLNYYITDNSFWFETSVTTFYLLIVLITTIKKLKYKEIIIGILVLCATFIKPNAIVILLPLVLTCSPIQIVAPIAIGWGLIYSLYFFLHGTTQLHTYLFLFNSSLPMKFLLPTVGPGDLFFHLLLLSLFIFLIVVSILNRKLRTNIVYILYVLTSLIFVIVLYDRVHFVPLIAFICIFASVVVVQSKKIIKIGVITFLVCFIIILCRSIKHEYLHFYSKSKYSPPIYTSVNKSILDAIDKNKLNGKRLFMFGNAPELYMLTNQSPPVSMSIVLYPYFHPFFPRLDERFTQEIQHSKPEVIIYPIPKDKEYSSFPLLQKYINDSYRLLDKKNSFEIWIQKSLKPTPLN